ncbi:MAG: response regulator [bacterium]
MKIFKRPASFDLLSAGLLAVGLVAVAMVFYSQRLMSHTFDRDAVLIRLSDAVRLKIAVAHLWFEEALTGDESIELQRDIYQQIDSALALIAAGLNGGETALGTIEAVTDPRARQHLLRLQEAVGRWRAMTEQRWQNRETSGRTGDTEDQAYDAVFKEILHRSEKVAHAMRAVVARDRAELTRINQVITLFFPVLFASIAMIEIRHRRSIVASKAALESRVAERTARLAESEANLWAILDNAADSIITIDTRGTIELFNRAAVQCFGYAPTEVVGKNVSVLMPAPDRQRHDDYLSRYLATGEKRIIGTNREVEAMRKDGTTFPVELAISDVWQEGKRVFIGIMRDITERKRVEEELRQAMEAAEAASRAKSEFLANMSHEIRTPMNGVIGMTGLLLETELTDEQRQYAETVRNSGDVLLTVINDILDFSKIEAGKLELEMIDFDLQAMLDDVADLLAFKAEDKGLAFGCVLAPEVESFVHGDPGRLRQILLNLANNAIKFTSQGEVTIHGQLEHETENEVCVRFSVRDTGIGIPEAALGKLFQSFTQVDASTTRKFGGTGLGLAISRQLAEMMGGEIGVESEESKGSIFWFTTLLEKQPPERRRRRRDDIDLSGKHILVVDDHRINREILRVQLQARGCTVDEALNGPHALSLLRQQAENATPFDIAIVDMQMPGMDGAALGKAIKSDAALKDTILIMLTSLGQRGDAKRMREIGFQAYMTKPLKQSQLYDCLITVLGLRAETEENRKKLVTRHTLTENRRQNAKVLVVDDNIVNQKVAAKMMQKLGYRVDCVANGKEAVNAVKLVPYDLVLMDCQMPVMDGFEATRAIRSQQNPASHITIIAMTANAMRGDREKCLEAGMDDYVTKPVNASKLETALKKWEQFQT